MTAATILHFVFWRISKLNFVMQDGGWPPFLKQQKSLNHKSDITEQHVDIVAVCC